MPVTPVKTEGRAPIVHDQHHILCHPQVIQQGIEIGAVFNETIGLRATLRQFVRVAHTDQIRCDTPPQPLEMRHDIAPEIGRRRVAMQKENGVATALIDVSHRPSENRRLFFGVSFIC